jgi:hypothetical protein
MLPPAPLKDSKHSPFAHDVTIQGIADHVDVMNSLQKPKKVQTHIPQLMIRAIRCIGTVESCPFWLHQEQSSEQGLHH